jgi:hypothetical protein
MRNPPPVTKPPKPSPPPLPKYTIRESNGEILLTRADVDQIIRLLVSIEYQLRRLR